MVYDMVQPCHRLTAQRKSCIFVYTRQFVQEAYNGVFEDLFQFLQSVVKKICFIRSLVMVDVEK
jgi:hypothetical protein